MSASPQIQRQALLVAADWYAQLCSENSDQQDDLALKDWIDSDPIHQWAWSRVEELQSHLGAMPASLAVDTFERADRPISNNRRTVLKGFALMIGAGSIAWANDTYNPRMADHYTTTGEIKTISLDDGSMLILNTASAVDVLFTKTERRIILRQGEILIETSKNENEKSRPFLVQTAQGTLRALGTRFSVRKLESKKEDLTLLNVFQHSVEVTMQDGLQRICSSGQGLLIGTNTISEFLESENKDSWTQNMIVADNMRLDDFLVELSRYRKGLLRCDPAVANYRISGAFKTDNTDQALLALQKSFPVTINYRSRYWVNVTPE